MTTKKTNLNTTIDPSLLFLLIAMLIGGYLRLAPVLQSAVPLNDGGMFYTMTQDLMDNGFRLPAVTSYNQMEIPFAYSPLSFYLAGFLVKIMGWELLDIIRILPAVFTVLAIPAFFLLAKRLLMDPFQVIFATLLFTFLPTTFDWMIMGGGLTRAVGFFFFLLSLNFIHRLYTGSRWLDVLWSALFSSLALLSHPEAGLFTAASALVFFWFFGKNRQGVVRSLAVAGLVLLFSAPWWLGVVLQHGFSPFFTAGGTGLHSLGQIFSFLLYDPTHEIGLKSIAVLALLGVFLLISRRQWLLVVWVLVFLVVEPRSSGRFLTVCFALAASEALLHILRWLDARQAAGGGNPPQPLGSAASRVFFLVLFAQWIFSAGANGVTIANYIITPADQAAFAWVRGNTPPESRFLLLSGEDPLANAAAEWFPALTERRSVATIQGTEWQRERSFTEVVLQSAAVQNCIPQSYACVEDWAESSQAEFDYLYLHLPGEEMEEPALGALARLQGALELVYEVDGVFVYHVKK